MRRIALFASISALLLAMLPLGPVQAAGPADPGRVPGSYIVVLKDGEPGAVAAEHGRRHNASVTHVYRHALRGYSARMSDRAAANIARDARVAYVEPDGVVTTTATTQNNATWGLDRIDQRARPTNGTYIYDTTGAGVTAYVIDTGIRLSHSDFGGRATSGFDAVDGGSADDCNGHGTHVAGTVGGNTWGVAKGVSLVAVRVLSCSGSGTTSGVIAGVDWVKNNSVGPAVANMSLGGGASTSLDTAVGNLAAKIPVVVAAGNGNQAGKAQDACNYSPARVPAAITIGATTSSDAKTSWSNYGNCVDFFAPGANITSAWYDSNTATRTISGTSMAAPHVAGAAALYLQGKPATTLAATVSSALAAATTPGIVTSSSTPNNDLLFTGTDETPPDPPNAAPTVSISSPASGASFDAGTVVPISATAGDSDGNVGSVAFYANDVLISTDSNGSDGWAASWNTSDLDGSYFLVARATDDDGASTTSAGVTVTVAPSEPPPGGSPITLTVRGSKTKGVMTAALTWSGATTTVVDVFRNGSPLITTPNDGSQADTIGKGSGTFTYKVCDAGTTTCSNEATVTF